MDQPIDPSAALAGHSHEPRLLQNAQVPGRRGPAAAESARDLPGRHAPAAMVDHQEDLPPGGVGQGREDRIHGLEALDGVVGDRFGPVG